MRVLLKISGEALMGDNRIHDYNLLKAIVIDIKAVMKLGIEVCIVVGGGNICRGNNLIKHRTEKITADYMGMLATIINALALQDIMEKAQLFTRVQSSIPIPSICEPFIYRRAINHMEKGRVVIFAAGIGNPFFTTDSAAVLRAIEVQCDFLFKGTTINGIYSKDPIINSNATKYKEISYNDILKDNLQIMDMAAIAIAKEHKLPIKVFSIKEPGSFLKVLQDKGEFSIIR